MRMKFLPLPMATPRRLFHDVLDGVRFNGCDFSECSKAGNSSVRRWRGGLNELFAAVQSATWL
jgi:hypothetical protein